ncbi:HEAT repeat domain-containing protein, partial [bacterium]
LIEVLLKDKDWEVRCYAAQALENIGGQKSAKALIEAVNNDLNEDVRFVIAGCMGELGDKTFVEPLIKCLKQDKSELVRLAVIKSLGKLKDEKVVDELINVLDEKNENEVCKALAEIGGRRSAKTIYDNYDKYVGAWKDYCEKLLYSFKDGRERLLRLSDSEKDYQLLKNAIYAGKQDMKDISLRRTAIDLLLSKEISKEKGSINHGFLRQMSTLLFSENKLLQKIGEYGFFMLKDMGELKGNGSSLITICTLPYGERLARILEKFKESELNKRKKDIVLGWAKSLIEMEILSNKNIPIDRETLEKLILVDDSILIGKQPFMEYLVEALIKAGDDRVIDVLIKLTGKNKEGYGYGHYLTPKYAIKKLIELDINKGIKQLTMMLRDGADSKVILPALEMLKEIGGRQILRSLNEALNHKDSKVREKSVEVLGSLKDEWGVYILFKALKDEDDSVRRSAVKALGGIGGEQAIPGLLRKKEELLKQAREKREAEEERQLKLEKEKEEELKQARQKQKE